jgi:hypothetical protein
VRYAGRGKFFSRLLYGYERDLVLEMKRDYFRELDLQVILAKSDRQSLPTPDR